MDFKVGDKIGPWTIQSIIRIERSRCIAVVNQPNISKEYVIKIKYKPTEYRNIIKYDLTNHNGIKLPNHVQVFGENGSDYTEKFWYVMEKYDADCSKGNTFDLDINKLIQSTIGFLKHLHREHKIIHGDIKLENILYRDGTYTVCDYEAMTEAETSTLCNEDDYNNYYFYSYGAEYDKPIFSYRFDLQSLGYMLMIIDNNYNLLDFQTKAQKYYTDRSRSNHYAELEILKAKYEISDKINAYFKIIDAVDWFCLDPPANEIYDGVIALFS